MKKPFIFSIILALGFATSALAQEEAVDIAAIQKIKEEGLTKSQVMQTAFYLTDVSGPRLANSPGLKKAEDWAASTLKRWGLQNVALEPWGTFGRGWEVQKSYIAMSAPYYHALIASPKAWTPSTNGPIKAEVVLVKADSVADLAKYKGTLAGKVIIFDVNTAITTSFKSDGSRYTDEELAKMTEPAAPRTPNAGGPAPAAMEAMRKQRALRSQINDLLIQENVGLILSNGRGTHGTFFTSN
ncbi:MAG: peptidase M28, partial [Sphingobacteriia bacterium]|nr:peptidase M28 [Sphingobacteriia bacterium]